MSEVNLSELEQRARGGDGEAMFLWARTLDGAGRHGEAIEWLRRASAGGHLASMSYLGARLVVGRAAPVEPKEGARLLAAAAKKGHPGSAYLCSILAARGVGMPRVWSQAMDWLRKAAREGDERAKRQLEIIGPSLEPWLAAPVVEPLHADPRIACIRGFAPRAACDWIIERARSRLIETGVYRPEGSDPAARPRTNTGAGFALFDGDVVLNLVRGRMAKALGVHPDVQEPANVLHYEVGQTFEAHYDYLNPDAPGFAEVIAREGQRTATFLVYLNDGYEGGATEFTELGFSFKGAPGDALIVHNVDEAGRVDPRTLHAGLPPTSGEKWLLSQWFRSKPQPVV